MGESPAGIPASPKNGELLAVDERAAFLGEQKELDAVVFVHGLGGHHVESWKKFPKLLASDPDLPRLDVFLRGYDSGLFRPGIAGIETVGGQFMSEITVRFQRDNALHLVGHSLGGLIILKGIVSEMIAMRALKAPTSNVSFISLFASPVSGSTAAAIMQRMLGGFLSKLGFVNRQIREVARGTYIDDLLTEVVNRVHAPQKTDDSRRVIPIRMVMATRDQIVDETDRRRASARFQTNSPLEFDYDHWTIKEPTDHNDRRYRAQSDDVQDGLRERYHKVCADLKSVTQDVREAAAIEFERRYEHIFRRRLEDHDVDVDSEPALYRSYLMLIVDDCLRCPRPPYYAADRALTHMIELGLVGREH